MPHLARHVADAAQVAGEHAVAHRRPVVELALDHLVAELAQRLGDRLDAAALLGVGLHAGERRRPDRDGDPQPPRPCAAASANAARRP